MRNNSVLSLVLSAAVLAITTLPAQAGFRIRFDSSLADLVSGNPPRHIDREAVELAVSETNSIIADEAAIALQDINTLTDETILKIQQLNDQGFPFSFLKRATRNDRRQIDNRATEFSIDAGGIAGEGVAAVRLAGGTGEDEWDIRWTSIHAQEDIYAAAKDARKTLNATLRLARDGLLPPPAGDGDEPADDLPAPPTTDELLDDAAAQLLAEADTAYLNIAISTNEIVTELFDMQEAGEDFRAIRRTAKSSRSQLKSRFKLFRTSANQIAQQCQSQLRFAKASKQDQRAVKLLVRDHTQDIKQAMKDANTEIRLAIQLARSGSLTRPEPIALPEGEFLDDTTTP